MQNNLVIKTLSPITRYNQAQLSQGESVFVRIIKNNGNNSWTVSFSGGKFLIKSDIPLKEGDSFLAKVKINDNKIILIKENKQIASEILAKKSEVVFDKAGKIENAEVARFFERLGFVADDVTFASFSEMKMLKMRLDSDFMNKVRIFSKKFKKNKKNAASLAFVLRKKGIEVDENVVEEILGGDEESDNFSGGRIAENRNGDEVVGGSENFNEGHGVANSSGGRMTENFRGSLEANGVENQNGGRVAENLGGDDDCRESENDYGGHGRKKLSGDEIVGGLENFNGGQGVANSNGDFSFNGVENANGGHVGGGENIKIAFQKYFQDLLLGNVGQEKYGVLSIFNHAGFFGDNFDFSGNWIKVPFEFWGGDENISGSRVVENQSGDVGFNEVENANGGHGHEVEKRNGDVNFNGVENANGGHGSGRTTRGFLSIFVNPHERHIEKCVLKFEMENKKYAFALFFKNNKCVKIKNCCDYAYEVLDFDATNDDAFFLQDGFV